MPIRSLFNRFGSHGSLDSNRHIPSFSVVVVGEPNSGKTKWFGTFAELKNRLSASFDSKNVSKDFEPDETKAKLVRFKHSQVAFSEVEEDKLEEFSKNIENASVCVICFSLVNIYTFESVKKWYNSISSIDKNKKIIIVGCKMDLRDKLTHSSSKKERFYNEIGNVPKSLLEPSKNDFFHMDNMPSEILELIFSYLNAVDRGRMALVCKKWNTILEDDFAWTGVIKGAPIPSSYGKKLGDDLGCKYFECSATTKKGMRKVISHCISEIKKK